ncbi:hypothetical protein AVEN_56233-1 [Araneus ventricosus]|uniref:Uncharacterized protein n=1 Tax=Araneus ventricosus TaxID=182803 RepID=A0A4Y2QIA6_ARAVE|nr:hypothetical protein AVEN_56233-1 [Araneus ventricosus]
MLLKLGKQKRDFFEPNTNLSGEHTVANFTLQSHSQTESKESIPGPINCPRLILHTACEPFKILVCSSKPFPNIPYFNVGNRKHSPISCQFVATTDRKVCSN